MRDYLEYLTIPYDAKEFNCYSLVRLFYRQEFGLELPIYDLSKKWPIRCPTVIYQLGDENGFSRVDTFRYGDVLLLTENNRFQHLGVVIEDGYFLHTTKSGTVINEYQQGYWYNRVVSIFRHRSRELSH